MAIRSITAPGVEIHEIDKSGYTPVMTGTTVYLKGFSPKGEPYKYMEVTTRSAFEQIYGTPDTEAERYFYAGACETLNQGGRLYAARLPYDNEAFEKMVGIKYTVEWNNTKDLSGLSGETGKEYISAICEVDSEINDTAIIRGGKTPILYDLSAIDEFRTDEAKVPANSFLIVDTTGATYGRVIEDDRKGYKREVIGIIPVVTTAANALYAQSYITCPLCAVHKFESLEGDALLTLKAIKPDGSVITVDGKEMTTAGLSATDLIPCINLDNYYKWFDEISVNVLSTDDNIQAEIDSIIKRQLTSTTSYDQDLSAFTDYGEAQNSIEAIAQSLSAPEKDFSISTIENVVLTGETSADAYVVVSASMMPLVLTVDLNSSVSYEDQISGAQSQLEENGYNVSEIAAQFGYHGINGDDTLPNTIALDAATYFPTIQPAVDGEGLDPEHLKDIGVIVYRAYLDPAEGNKVNVEPVEAYAGSLYKDDKDPNTGVTKFIDTIINSQSRYINFFSNCFSSKTAEKFYKDECDILIAPPSQGACLGLYSPMTKKDISISRSILDGLNKCFEKASDINQLDIDVVPDAGVSNIASYIKAIFGEKGPYDLAITDDLGNSLLGMWTCKKATDAPVKMWKTVLMKYDNFCKNIRKDCMFTADGLRPLVLQGQKKIVRDTKPTNSIDKDILPFLPAICGLNTNYGAGYADWFEQADDYTGDFFWCPPSIKATGVYINTDLNFDYWLAPAGLNRGIIAATDVSFSPNGKQAGAFYEKNWNYAINYPQDGIVLEGQKTFQTKPTALDRVNVRRMMLRLERSVYKTIRYYVYENNTAYTRQRIVDALDPIFKSCWQSGNGGLNRYKIVCDESNNTPNVIDNNELKVQIGLVPNKSAEYILVDFIIGNQSSTWEELF